MNNDLPNKIALLRTALTSNIPPPLTNQVIDLVLATHENKSDEQKAEVLDKLIEKLRG